MSASSKAKAPTLVTTLKDVVNKAVKEQLSDWDTEDWLKNEILNVVDKSPKYFLEIVNHPQSD